MIQHALGTSSSWCGRLHYCCPGVVYAGGERTATIAAANAAARRLVVLCDASTHARPADQSQRVCFCAGKFPPHTYTHRVYQRVYDDNNIIRIKSTSLPQTYYIIRLAYTFSRGV